MILERLRNRRFATAAVVLFGGGLAVACGNTVEGIGNVPMVNCSANGTPRSNSDTIQAVPRGEVLQMGKSIVTDSKGDYPATGDISVKSEGDGTFKVSVDNSNQNNDSTNDHLSIIPNYPGSLPNTVTIADSGELFTVSGIPGPNRSTGLTIAARCL